MVIHIFSYLQLDCVSWQKVGNFLELAARAVDQPLATVWFCAATLFRTLVGLQDAARPDIDELS